ncbi:MAG: OmpA family protein [Odoribacter sp.]|nr:OmpA family protein [Odoribacter sp.]
MKKILFIFTALLFCVSCVPKKKFLIAENGRLAAIQRGDKLQSDLNDCRETGRKLISQVNYLEADTTEMGATLRAYRRMLTSNKSEHEKLNTLLEEKMQKLEEREATINELRAIIDAQNEQTRQLLSSLKDALIGFSSEELSVTEKDGKIYVAMSDKLLFESGSATVDKRGKEALAKLAEVLNKQNDIDVVIEGHTDSKPISTVRFKDNWDLSVIRATSVVRILTQDYKVNSLQVQPTGRGEYMPVADNSTAEGRSLNRRTEIIISPKMDKIMNLLQRD